MVACLCALPVVEGVIAPVPRDDEGPPDTPLSVEAAAPPLVGLFSSDAAEVDPLVAAGGGVAPAGVGSKPTVTKPIAATAAAASAALVTKPPRRQVVRRRMIHRVKEP